MSQFFRSAKAQQSWYHEECSKSVIKTLYGSKSLVSEYIFKLVYHSEGSGWSEICCARDIAKKSLNRLLLLLILKSSYPRCTVEKGVFKNFTNFTGKHLCWSKLQGWRAYNFIKKNFLHSCFPVNFAKFLRTPIFKNICERLLLYLHVILFTMRDLNPLKGTLMQIWKSPYVF